MKMWFQVTLAAPLLAPITLCLASELAEKHGSFLHIAVNSRSAGTWPQSPLHLGTASFQTLIFHLWFSTLSYTPCLCLGSHMSQDFEVRRI